MSTEADLSGKTIVITGASSGFGRGAAEKLAGLGANVVVAARRGDVLDDLVAQIAESGGAAVAVVTDVSAPADIAALVQTALELYGAVDVWINNAGIGALGMFWDIPIEDHARVIEVNLTGLIYGTHAALRYFRSRGSGILINVGSVDSEVPFAYQSSYAASKAAVLSLGRSLKEDLRIVGDHDTIRVEL